MARQNTARQNMARQNTVENNETGIGRPWRMKR